MTPQMWKSTFWQQEFARPDKLTSFLNKVIIKDQGKNRTVHVNDQELANSASTEGKFSVGKLFGGGGKLSGDHKKKTHVSDDQLKQWLKEQHYDVEWTGELFKVKPVDLYRLNMQQLGQKQNIATTYVQVHQVQYTYNVGVSFPGDSTDTGPISTQAINQRLDKIEGTENRARHSPK